MNYTIIKDSVMVIIILIFILFFVSCHKKCDNCNLNDFTYNEIAYSQLHKHNVYVKYKIEKNDCCFYGVYYMYNHMIYSGEVSAELLHEPKN